VQRSDARALAGALLILTGAAAIAAALGGYLKSPIWQAVHAEEVVPPDLGLAPATAPRVQDGSPIARLRIPLIQLDVAVLEGTRPEDLLKAPGHLAGTGLPGEPRNIILAGHRDLHFRRLGSLKAGDRIELQAGGRSRAYQVQWSRVVRPTETSVLAPGDREALTLVTCYPFHYVGAAPRRYIVRAFPVDAVVRNP
jgi:sortase A